MVQQPKEYTENEVISASEKNEDIIVSGINNAGMAEVVQRHAAAAKEHIVAYTGINNETGTKLSRGLKDIAKSKINPQYRNQNVQQQAGYSAEVKATARENAQKILNGATTRIRRTDDLNSVNDPLYDFKEVDLDGNEIPNTGIQMKFVGKNPRECLNKLMSSKYRKYRDRNIPFEIPSDFYDGVCQEVNSRIEELEKQIQAAQKLGKFDVVQKKQEQLEQIKKIKIKKSTVSKSEAIDARISPKLSTAKDIHRISHKAGKQSAKYGFTVGGAISGIQNMVRVFQGTQRPIDALKETSFTATKSAMTSYVTTYGSTTLTSFMKNSNEQFIRTLSKTGLPSTLISTAVTSLNTAWHWLRGDITGTECMEQIGKNGASIMMSTSYAAAGQVLIPIPVVGGLIGGMIGYALVSSCYSGLMQTLKEAEIAHEERIRIETECEIAIKAIREYRTEINHIMEEYLKEYQSIFDIAFENIKTALQTGNADNFISSVNIITRKLKGNPEFDTVDEFNIRMADPTIIKL